MGHVPFNRPSRNVEGDDHMILDGNKQFTSWDREMASIGLRAARPCLSIRNADFATNDETPIVTSELVQVLIPKRKVSYSVLQRSFFPRKAVS